MNSSIAPARAAASFSSSIHFRHAETNTINHCLTDRDDEQGHRLSPFSSFTLLNIPPRGSFFSSSPKHHYNLLIAGPKKPKSRHKKMCTFSRHTICLAVSQHHHVHLTTAPMDSLEIPHGLYATNRGKRLLRIECICCSTRLTVWPRW